MFDKLIALYLIVVNAAGFMLMMIDKIKAKKNLWRIPEATLFLVAAIGGSIGSIAGMYTFRHKTKHMKFTFGMPLILAAQIVVIVLLVG
jgi:uncharacterized membrane protein YsdA (DUF1294 family)